MKEIRCKYIYEQYIIVTARCRLQYHMNVCRKHYKHFECKRLHITKNANILNGKESAL